MTAIVLIGPMGVGKSSIGKKLSKQLGVGFVDTDQVIVREHGVIAEIFANHGEAHFRELEHVAVAEAVAAGGVVAVGGGAVLHPATQDLLAQHTVILLDVEPAVVAGRIGQGADRPLLSDGDDPLERWKTIRAARMPLYERLADATFDTSRGHIANIVSAIADWVKENDK